jgi:hypothetical protein
MGRDDRYVEVFFERWFFYHGNHPALQWLRSPT